MKKMKIFVTTAIVMLVASAGYFGYSTYEIATMTDAERMIQANLEALTCGTARKNRGLIWDTVCYANNYGATCRYQSDCSK